MPNFSGFDPKSLLTTTVKAKLDTHRVPIPLEETDEFMALCTSVDTHVITSQKERTFGEQYVSLDSIWEIMDDHVKAVTKLEKPTARYSFIIECDPVRGLEVGEQKNIKLGALLDACGISSKEWSISMIQGCTAWIKIKHRQDEQDDEQVYNEVVRVTKSPRRR